MRARTILSVAALAIVVLTLSLSTSQIHTVDVPTIVSNPAAGATTTSLFVSPPSQTSIQLPASKRPQQNPSPTEGSSRCSDLPLNTNITRTVRRAALCYDATQCSGYIHIEANPSCQSQSRPLSKSTADSARFLAMGADVFRLRLDGPEVLLVTSKPTGDCQYRLDIPQLVSKGDYNLGLEWLYGDYHALDEITKHWPPLRKQPVFPAAPFATQYHLQQCTLPSTQWVSCERANDQLQETSSGSMCTGLEKNTSGRWVKEEGTVHTRVRVKKIQRNPIVFQWAIQGDSLAHWTPESCQLSRRTAESARAALKGKRLIVGGDSQSRALYYSIVNFLSGYGNECLRNISTIDAEPSHCIANVKGSQRKKVAGLDAIDFVDDHFLDKLPGRYQGYDVVVVGFAQHPASKEHWSYAKYRNALDAKLTHAKSLAAAGTAVVWLLAPQYPHTKQGYPVVVKDWRTDMRLTLFNDYAKEKMQAAGIPVIDAFAISTGMSHTSPDQAHFSNFVAYEFVQMLMSVLCNGPAKKVVCE